MDTVTTAHQLEPFSRSHIAEMEKKEAAIVNDHGSAIVNDHGSTAALTVPSCCCFRLYEVLHITFESLERWLRWQ